ncbi:MAG: Hpt domain-containing protein [Rhizobiaceae bacterium]|nr:Hpt domain-containing protein [Rhizobiaceae bacterium]
MPPIDVSHLAAQTMDDSELQREILKLFDVQLEQALSELGALDEDGIRRLAHKLKGSARSVGAFPLADCAERLMELPTSAVVMEDLKAEAATTRDFLVTLIA